MSPKLLNLLLIISSFAMYYLLINPLYTGVGPIWQPENSVTSLRSLNQQYDDVLAQAESLNKEAEDLRKKYNSLDADSKKKMETMVPTSIDPVRFLSEVNKIAAESGIALVSTSYSDTPKSATTPAAYQLSFSVKTTYAKFKEFMSNYENSLRLFTLQSVSFSAPEKEGDLTTFQVKLNTYYLK
ncbi:MAG: type 4a pilus biogenesis protein PilO [Candidatus Paceibacterota bacterium]